MDTRYFLLTYARELPARLLAELSGTPRYYPPFEWSRFWVCNVFRIWEQVFGRRIGIRIEQISDKFGNVFSFTLENYLATLEGAVRAWFRNRLAFKIVRVPELQLAGFGSRLGVSPYRFAVAFDVALIKQSGTTSWSHTVTGANPYLLVAEDQNQNVSGITYNSVSMTQQVQVIGSGSWETAGVWGLGNPSTGANTVSITTSGAGFYSGSVSYSGAQSTTAADNTGTASQASASTNLSLTFSSVADNCWQIAWFQSADTSISIVTGTARGTGGDNFEWWADTNAAVSPAGSTTLTADPSGLSKIVAAGVTIAPFVAAGPANLKTFNGLSKASIKTINGLAIGSTKSVNGLT